MRARPKEIAAGSNLAGEAQTISVGVTRVGFVM